MFVITAVACLALGWLACNAIYFLKFRVKEDELEDLDKENRKLNNELLKLSDQKGMLEVEIDRLQHDLDMLRNPNGDKDVGQGKSRTGN